MVKRWSGACALLLVLSLSRWGWGQSSEAEQQYRRGLSAFQAGDYVAACRALAESYRLEPLPGALFTLATCEMRAGRLVAAAARFSEFLTLVETLPPEQRVAQDERRIVAEDERRRLFGKIPHLKLVSRGSSVQPLQVSLDGVPLGAESLGVELAVEPGEHVIEQQLKDGQVRSDRVTLRPGETKLVVLSATDPAPRAATPTAPAPAAPAPAAAPASAPVGPRQTPASSSQTFAYVAGGVGVAGLVVGSVAGVLALGNASVVTGECEGPACSVKGKDAADEGQAQALVSTIGFGIGLAGLVTGTVLWLSGSPRDSGRQTGVQLRVSPGAVALAGAF